MNGQVCYMTGDQISSLGYEAAFEQLEEVLQMLESGTLPLEESLALYEQGLALAAHCSQLLDTAELRVQQWQPGHQTTPVEDWQEG
jgi:exodeoxyribonuclease VII small subunit